MPSLPFVNDNLGSPAAGDTTLGVERLRPLFHLFNGDLCYANLAEDRSCVINVQAKDAATDTASSKASLRGSSVNVSRIKACRTKNSSSNSFTIGFPVFAQLRQ